MAKTSMPPWRYTLDLVKENWPKNYRHAGGPASLARCVVGTFELLRADSLPAANVKGRVDCVTFSVVPNLTRLWAKLMARAIPENRANIWVGDCSGGFDAEMPKDTPLRAYPLINFLHGWKLDLFFEKFIRSEFFVVSDDDIFWLSERPIEWALDQFARNSKLAVVSLEPRKRFHWELDGLKHQPMGSYCLVIRRDVWQNEGLSFQAVPKPSPSKGSYAGHYDTCDFANVELIKRGYEIAIAPPEITNCLAGFKGVSSAVIRIQANPAKGYAETYNDGPAAIVETCLLAKHLSAVFSQAWPNSPVRHLVNPVLAEQAERALIPFLADGAYGEIQSKVSSMVDRVSSSLCEAQVARTAASM